MGRPIKQNKLELTKREKDVLKLILKGKSNKEIGQELNIVLATTKLHVSNVLRKHEVKDRTNLVIKMMKRKK